MLKYLDKQFCVAFIIVMFLSACQEIKEKEETSEDIYRSFELDKGASLFSVPPGMVSIFLDDSQVGNQELKAVLKDTKLLTFLILRNKSNVKESEAFSELSERLGSINFNDLAMLNNGNEIVRVKIQREEKHVSEMVVIVSKYEVLYCVSFKGNLGLENVLNLNQPENFAAISNLNRFRQ